MYTLDDAKKDILDSTSAKDKIDITTLNICAEVLRQKIQCYINESLKLERVIHKLVKQLEGILDEKRI